MAGDIVNLGEKRDAWNKQIFSAIAEEIRDGKLYAHFFNNDSLFDKVTEIFDFALSGAGEQPLSSKTPVQIKAEINNRLAKIEELLAKDPKSDHAAVRFSLDSIRKKLNSVL